MFARNVAGPERAARLAIGIVLVPVGLLLLGGLAGEILGITVAAVGFVGLATGLGGFCPLCVPIGLLNGHRRKTALRS